MATLKHSKQRDAILDYLKPRKDHPTADQIYSDLRNDFPNISLGTVYRNLTLLTDLGQILRLNLGNGMDHFDYNTNPHDHFICQDCGSVLDIDIDQNMSDLPHLQPPHSSSFGGRIDGQIVYYYGLCGNCLHNPPKQGIQ